MAQKMKEMMILRGLGVKPRDRVVDAHRPEFITYLFVK